VKKELFTVRSASVQKKTYPIWHAVHIVPSLLDIFIEKFREWVTSRQSARACGALPPSGLSALCKELLSLLDSSFFPAFFSPINLIIVVV